MERLVVGGWLALAMALALGGCSTVSRNCPPAAPPPPRVSYEPARFPELPGWRADAVEEAWPALLNSCLVLAGRAPQWADLCNAARALSPPAADAARAFFERYFDPYHVVQRTAGERKSSGLITGYYEPQLRGARIASPQFATPLYAPPPDLLTVELSALYPELKGKRLRARLEGNKVVPYYSRGELAAAPELAGQELVWVDSALDALLLEVQGSGRVQLADGETIRLQYADENGQPYRSIGRYLVDRGELSSEQANLPGIRQWAASHPERLKELLDANPSVVFFHEEPIADAAIGPKGTLGVPLTAGRSIAVDRTAVPLGAPVFLVTTWPETQNALERLVLAQDTGGAIHGAVRADFFWGTGAQAGDQAGRMRESGQLWLLWPKGLPLP
jgi:membrane-bound lytic murein transglycosylase A